MDYKKIYNEFIKDRKIKEPKEFKNKTYYSRTKKNPEVNGVYHEQHHILARSLGGTNESDNIITLPATDHFFAHLLLSKIYGGKMWAAINLMSKKRTIGRKAYYWGKVARSKQNKDNKKYLLMNFDGDKIFGTKDSICEKTGFNKKSINGVINGTDFSNFGFFYIRHFKKYQHNFTCEINPISTTMPIKYKIYDEKKNEHIVTRDEMIKLIGKSATNALLAKGTRRIWGNGFTMDKNAESKESILKRVTQNAANSRGYISGKFNPRADQNIYRFYNYFTKENFIGTRADMSLKYNLDSRIIGLILSNNYDHNKGWRSGNNYKVMKPNVYTKGVKLYG